MYPSESQPNPAPLPSSTSAPPCSSPLPGPTPDKPLGGVAKTIDRTSLVVICWLNVCTSLVLILLRLFVRWRRNGRLLYDDYWMIFGWLTLFAMAIIQMKQMDSLWWMTLQASGHITPCSPADFRKNHLDWMLWSFPLTYLYWTGLWAVKASFLTAFYRLVTPKTMARRFWYAVTILTVLTYFAGWTAGLLVCDHPSEYFAGECYTPEERERARFAVIFATTCDVTTDLLILAVPIGVLPSLNLDAKKKVGLAVAFSLVLITISIAVLRMWQNLKGDLIDFVAFCLWGNMGLYVALVVGSLPPLKGFFTNGFRRFNRSLRNNQSDTPGQAAARENYGPKTGSRSVMVAESIPLDDMHQSKQLDGGIYVHKTCDIVSERATSPREESEDGVLKSGFAADKL
ncbi:hypothetical protein CCHL11_05161 [Colletotrichum chlorophyti]|uniref:Rhodopsin domain-containing protein n=1 Tax=Colletotrichum chlorophyti TaxID=708187 RepID=A0A1Q8S225_9PEZI|nr:hypothetical protein CCHL11_05161 [Colletotrichum chlorophyti]